MIESIFPMKNAILIPACFVSIAVLLAAAQGPASSQPAEPPPADIYLATLKGAGAGLTTSAPVNVTHRAGYDNQPRFAPDGKSFLYASYRDGQSDVYQYHIGSGKITQITRTAESEYSPSLMVDTRYLSAVVVENDGLQRLWKFPMAGGKPSLLIENVGPVGAYVWLDYAHLAIILAGTSPKLLAADLIKGEAAVIAKEVGRTLQSAPKGGISFVRIAGPGQWAIQRYDAKTGKTRTVTTIEGEDAEHAWLPDGSLLAPKDSAILRWKPGAAGWTRFADFAAQGLHGISRIAVSRAGDRIALVAADSK